jgi:hypothetical protein
MNRTTNEVEQAVSRTLRDSLEKLQRSSDELHQAVGDLVSACASTRPANSLPSMIRAQTAAASLAASLDVLARFVTAALQPELRSAEELRHGALAYGAAPALAPVISEGAVVSRPAPEEARAREATPPPEMAPAGDAAPAATAVISEAAMQSQPAQTADDLRSSDMVEEGAPLIPAAAPRVEAGSGDSAVSTTTVEVIGESAAPLHGASEFGTRVASDAVIGSMSDQATEAAAEPSPERASESLPEAAPSVEVLASPSEPPPEEKLSSAAKGFDISRLPPEQQELHRRANRVAKVSMQDIRMLRPHDVKTGKEHKDLCHRLRDDIERAHKEYDRRFHAILGHPVDYFYDWMVEILADGDPGALGEYPYPSPVLRH